MNLPSQEQVREAYNRLPRPIREYLAGTELYDFSQGIGKRYGLHLDTISVLPDLIIHLLLGLINPLQFQQALRELMIPSEPANAIVQELNEKVFKPLQEKVRNAPPEEPEREELPAEPIPATQQPASVTLSAAPIYTPPPARIPAESLVPPPSIAPRPAPAPVQYSPVMPPPITPESRPVQAPPPAPAPRPTPIYSQPVPAPTPAPAYQPPVMPPPMSAPRPVAPPPANLPGANGPVPEWSGFSAMPGPVPTAAMPKAPLSAAPAAPQAPAPSPVRNDALHDVMKNYGVDPYREPPE